MYVRQPPRSVSLLLLGTAAVALLTLGDSVIPGAAQNAFLRAADPVAAAAPLPGSPLSARYTAASASASSLPVATSASRSPVLAVVPVAVLAAPPTSVSGAPLTPPAQGKEQAIVLPTVDSGPIPAVALAAYRRAAASVTCGLSWSLLAGIGKIESDHGRHAASAINAAGTALPPIYGPPTYLAGARAEGPMQFMPTTWALWAADGNGDGRTDPQNVFDETVAAARYLCAAGGDLRTSVGVRRAVFAYNHLDSYVADVLAYATAYADGTPVSSAGLVPITYAAPPAAPRPTPRSSAALSADAAAPNGPVTGTTVPSASERTTPPATHAAVPPGTTAAAGPPAPAVPGGAATPTATSTTTAPATAMPTSAATPPATTSAPPSSPTSRESISGTPTPTACPSIPGAPSTSLIPTPSPTSATSRGLAPTLTPTSTPTPTSTTTTTTTSTSTPTPTSAAASSPTACPTPSPRVTAVSTTPAVAPPMTVTVTATPTSTSSARK